jgi:beta-N-acetylhexosaminidase
MSFRASVVVAALALAGTLTVSPLFSQGGQPTATAGPTAPLDKAAEKWVAQTLKAMTLDEKIGQLIFPSYNAVFTSADSDVFEEKIHLARDLHVGGFHTFGGAELMPQLLLDANYGGASASRKGDPYAAAAMLNRLQRESKVPLLTTADFEGGVGYILNGATRLPRAMVLGAARDPDLAYQAGQLAASEGRSLGVFVDFYPVVDVNNNPRNPIINIRSFGEDVALVSDLARAYIRGIHAGGMLATAKHFPGHGDTATDTHLGLAVIDHPRSHLDEVELPPFAAAIAGGVDAVMSSHIMLPALDPTPGIPATLSRPILTGLLRDEMKFQGLVFTDSMGMWAVSRAFTPDKAAAMAVKAGADIVLDSPDAEAAFKGIKAAVQSGEIPESQIARSAERILRAKARLGLHRERVVDLSRLETTLGGRARAAVAADLCARGITLIKDERNQVPLDVPGDVKLLYLSVIDYASGWREGAPSRSVIPALKQRWPNTTAVEITDRTTPDEMDLVRELARRSDAVVVGIFVRIASYSGRMDLTPAQVALLDSLAALDRPVVAVAFGNPYVVSAVPKLPAILLAYEFFDTMEVAAVRALAGETAIGGRLPIALPGLFPVGHGLTRPARTPPSGPSLR